MDFPVTAELEAWVNRKGLRKATVGAEATRGMKERGAADGGALSQFTAASRSIIGQEGSSGVRLVWSQDTAIDRRTAKMRRPMIVLVKS